VGVVEGVSVDRSHAVGVGQCPYQLVFSPTAVALALRFGSVDEHFAPAFFAPRGDEEPCLFTDDAMNDSQGLYEFFAVVITVLRFHHGRPCRKRHTRTGHFVSHRSFDVES